jgi:hypothetical protein
MISPDLHFRDVLAFMCSNVFNCDLDRAIKTHRLSYRENTVNKLSALFKEVSLPDFDPSLTTYIRDGMALVQCMDAKKHRTFGDLATEYCRQLTSCLISSLYHLHGTWTPGWALQVVKNVVNRDIISAISQNQSTSENNF